MNLEKPFFKEVIALIQSKDFKSEVESLGFYDLRIGFFFVEFNKV
ncbi:hypothetical protein [Clostridium butyricum]|nr:MAG: hypothetical protein Q607_CBUC00193G0033 [Clostridium butyricum DORA_1]MDU5821092.1 hypothetical protein [Clostridium butyricum]